MGGFHQLCIFQGDLFKCHYFSLQDWFVDSGTIAAGSVGQDFEGRHYYRSMQLQIRRLRYSYSKKS